METDIRKGDIVRLTDSTLLGGEVIKVEKYENKDDYGIVSYEYGGTSGTGTVCEQISLGDFPLSELQPIIDERTVSSMTRFIERKTGIKLYPEGVVENWRHRAKVAEGEAVSWEKTATKEHETVLYWQDRAEKAEALLNQKKVEK
jgi:hypothetical protein